jgi:UDP-N-acetylglucosamine--N-acetylmuramyl-(pentapeptide) pyrophosphoryl-undecaprenol N-acetylglucosamine transferase
MEPLMTSRGKRDGARAGPPQRPSIAIAGGGTAGHVFPGLAVAEEISRDWQGSMFWIGSRSGMERKIVEGAGIRFYGIPAGKLRRYASLENFADILLFAAGVFSSVAILRRERPAALFSKGGYVSVPPVIAASLLGIPCFTHESDFDPGLATRINTRFCREIFVSFDRTPDFLPPRYRGKAVVTGNPVRSAIYRGVSAEGRRIVGCPASTPLVLVLGGSLGSAAINGIVASALPELRRLCFIVHQLGERSPLPAAEDRYYPATFFREELPHIMAAADLVVSRAGGNNLAELAALGKPSILIPLAADASRGDQIRNAEQFGRAGAALVLPQENASAAALVARVAELLGDRSRLASMGEKARALGGGNSAAEIARRILQSIGAGEPHCDV